MININQANIKDIPIIQEIARKTWPETFSAILSPEQISYMLKMMYSTESLIEQINLSGHKFLLAGYAGDLEEEMHAGYASYEPNFHCKRATKIHKIYILPEFQGEGIGSALMTSIEQLAKKSGDIYLTLNVNKNNPAISFYSNLGFEIIHEEKIPIGHNFFMDDFVMRKEI